MKNQRVFDETADFRRVLAGFGERSTPQRLAVWRFFTQSACARTMEDVVGALRGRGLGQATIYRVVHLFCWLDLLAGIRYIINEGAEPRGTSSGTCAAPTCDHLISTA